MNCCFRHRLSHMGARLFGLADSVWPIRSEPFRSRDFSVLVVPVSRHFGQARKSCRNPICSLLMQTHLNQRKVLFKKSTNMIQDPTVNQHEHMMLVIISKQIKSLSTFSFKYKYFKLIFTIQI